MEPSELLDEVRTGLQVWAATADGLVLQWANRPAGEALRWPDRVLTAALRQEPDAFVAPDGPGGWLRAELRPLGDRRVLVSIEDVTRERERDAAERLSGQIVDGLQEGVFVVDRDRRITRANEVAARMCGVSLGELTGSALADLPVEVLRPDGSPATLEEAPVLRALAGETVGGVIVQAVRRDGSRVWAEVNSRPLFEADGSPYGALSTYVDVTEREHRERRMRQEAESDPLTGLANRRALERALDAALARAGAAGREVGVLVVDLDGFKALNDRWGHPAGDDALREVARRLVRSVRERDVVARTGGDEFVLVLPDLHPGEGAAQACAERVAAALSPPVAHGEASTRLGAATGVACFPGDGADAAALLAHADRAMYRAKR